MEAAGKPDGRERGERRAPSTPTTVLRLASLALILLVTGCAGPSAESLDGPGDQAAFVTRLGADTLAVERFAHTPSGMTATVALRTPRTTLTTYDLRFDDDGHLVRYEAITRQPLTGEVLLREVAEPSGDSLRVTVAPTGEPEATRTVERIGRALPFVDMVHWPFDLMVERAVDADGPLDQPLFTRRGTVAFTSDVESDGTVIVRHPFRGAMTVQADARGRLASLDAGQTTRALTVMRVGDVDVEGAATRWSEMDAAGQSFGALSGRGETVETVAGATIAVDFGQPYRRGRDIWGALVSWGDLWRTGANRATHFTTDRDLVLGQGADTLAVPAGQYTLFSIPQPDGGVLIVNRQTGQNGNRYDASQDLGRIPMRRESLDASVEAFTVGVEPTGPGAGAVSLRWAEDAFVVPFTVVQ